MSAIAAIVDWDCRAPASETSALLASSLGRWKGDAIRVEGCAGATLGISLLVADASRRSDHQPIVDGTRKIALVADCRLDDREALRGELSLAPGASDADLLIAGYERWGQDLPRHLLGDFACVLWDWGRRVCVAFRDPLGVRPLFYATLPDGLAIASDVELIVDLVRPQLVPDDQTVIEHLLWEYTSTDRTFWATISKLPAGHLLVEGPSQTRSMRRHWAPEAVLRRFSSTAQMHDEFSRLFFQSVARRFDSTGPVLAHLSGGVDSSLIVCVADQIRRQPGQPRPALATVSQRFPDASWDEGEFIASVTEWTGIDGLEWDGRDAPFLDLAAPSLAGPGMRASRTSGSIGDLEIARQRPARVILSGEGGDQLGASWGLTDDLVADRPFGFAADTLLRSDLSLDQRLARVRRLLRRGVPPRLRRAMTGFRYGRDLPDWLQRKWRRAATDLVTNTDRDGSQPPFQHEVQRAHWRQLTSGRTAVALECQQVVAGRHGVELRFPFLDRELVELVLSLGPEHWPRGLVGARLHREAMGSLLPPKVRGRTQKAVFSGAMGQLLKRSGPRLDALFHEGEWLSSEYVVRGEAQGLLRRALAASDEDWRGHERDWLQVRAIATLETWLREGFGYASPGAGTRDD
jgi:asparagine synthase (glutamine-hydrolysing)